MSENFKSLAGTYQASPATVRANDYVHVLDINAFGDVKTSCTFRVSEISNARGNLYIFGDDGSYWAAYVDGRQWSLVPDLP